jgi:hypothetical protein
MTLPFTTGKKDFAMSTEKNTVPVITSMKNSQGGDSKRRYHLVHCCAVEWLGV